MLKLGCVRVCVREETETLSLSGADRMHISHQSHKIRSVGLGPGCGALRIWVGVKSLRRSRAQTFRPDTSIPQIYEAYCLCMPTASLRRAKNKEIWALCGQLLHTARDVSQRCRRPEGGGNKASEVNVATEVQNGKPIFA